MGMPGKGGNIVRDIPLCVRVRVQLKRRIVGWSGVTKTSDSAL